MADYFYCVDRVDEALAPIDGIVPVLGGFSIHLTNTLRFVSTSVQNSIAFSHHPLRLPQGGGEGRGEVDGANLFNRHQSNLH